MSDEHREPDGTSGEQPISKVRGIVVAVVFFAIAVVIVMFLAALADRFLY